MYLLVDQQMFMRTTKETVLYDQKHESVEESILV